jgi:hypothetical protein
MTQPPDFAAALEAAIERLRIDQERYHESAKQREFGDDSYEPLVMRQRAYREGYKFGAHWCAAHLAERIAELEEMLERDVDKVAAQYSIQVEGLEATVAKLREALEFVVHRQDFAFAESSVADEIWAKCKAALEGVKDE